MLLERWERSLVSHSEFTRQKFDLFIRTLGKRVIRWCGVCIQKILRIGAPLQTCATFPSLNNGSSIANPLLNLLPNHCQRAGREPQPLQTIVNLPLRISAALSIC